MNLEQEKVLKYSEKYYGTNGPPYTTVMVAKTLFIK